MVSDKELLAVRKYLRYLAGQWWDRQPSSRESATCDACGFRDVGRGDGYLIGSNLWCENCYDEKDVEGQVKKDPNALGYSVFQNALKMFGNS